MAGLLDLMLAGYAPGAGFLPEFSPEEEAAMAGDARDVAAGRLARGIRRPPPAFGAGAPDLSAMGMLGVQPWALGAGDPALPAPAVAEAPAPIEIGSGMEWAGAPEGVPLPRPRPIEADAPTEASTVARAGGGAVAGPSPMSMAPEEGGGLGGMLSGLAGKLLDPSKASALLAMGAGFSGAPSLGTGFRRASAHAIPVAQANQALGIKRGAMAATFQALRSRGVPAQEALAAMHNPEMMKAVSAKYFEGKPVEVNGRLVQVKPNGGGVEVLADFSREKAPAGFEWREDGTLHFIKNGPADPDYLREKGEKNAAPPGYMWKDPKQPALGLEAIPGGPATKVDAQVAARIGLAESFLGQLPQIKQRVAQGEATGPIDAAMGRFGVGAPGELRRQVQSGAEALLRNLTGAGMSIPEAEKYVKRYEIEATDTTTSVASKLNQLERELKFTMAAVARGRGGIKMQNGRIVTEDGEPASGARLQPGQTTVIDGVSIHRVN